LDYQNDELIIIVKDNGVGFLSEVKKEGISLSNIKNRAKLICVEVIFSS
jgi:signal transduction histidine kinase